MYDPPPFPSPRRGRGTLYRGWLRVRGASLALVLIGAVAALAAPPDGVTHGGTHGAVEVVAGSLDFGDGGPAAAALFVNIGGIAVDAEGNAYVVDSGANQVRRIDARTGVVTTVAGTGLVVGDFDAATARERPLRGPFPIALDAAGRSLYVGELLTRRVVRVDLASGAASDVGTPAGGFGSPDGLAWTADGLLVADAPRGQVWRLGPDGAWKGLLTEGVLTDSIRTLAPDARGRVYVSEYFAHRVLRIDPAAGRLEIALGVGEPGRGVDGDPAPEAAIRTPDGIAVETDGSLVVADKGNHRVCRVDALTGLLTTLAESSREGAGSRWTPGPIAVDAKGNVWIGDLERNRLLRLVPGASEPVVVAGDGDVGDGGPATSARLAHPGSVVADALGNLYVSDTLHHRLRIVDAATGRIRTLAGTGIHGYNGDAIPATEALLSYPAEVQLDGQGRVYLGDYYNNRVRVVDTRTGVIDTVLGNGQGSEDGDGGAAVSASMPNPHALLLEGKRSLLVASAISSRVRRVDLTDRRISTVPLGENVAPDLAFYGMAHWRGGVVMAQPRPGTIQFLKDGRLSRLLGSPDVFFPQDVTVSPDGELYICETGRNRVVKWTGREIEVVIDNLGRPGSISFDAKGNLLVSETFHNRVLRVSLPRARSSRGPRQAAR